MGSSSHLDLENLNLLLAHDNRLRDLDIEPTPYTFTKVENGKKMIIDSPSLSPPRWLLFDHTIAVIWLMFSSNFPLHQLNINDLKWAHEFLKEIRNSKGEHPPDVKTCLKEIQDRLIHLYARLTNLKDEFGRESTCEDSKMNVRQCEKLSLANLQSPSRTTFKLEYPTFKEHLSRDLAVILPNQKKTVANYSKKTCSLLSNNANFFEDVKNIEDTEVEQYFLSLFEEEKEEEILPNPHGGRSLIPTKRITAPSAAMSEVTSSRESGTLKESIHPKRVHCVAEMTSLKYRKSMKVQDKNGEEAAYANLKADIQKMTINPNVSKEEMKEYLEGLRIERVDKLRNDLNRLNSIEEIIKGIDDVKPNAGNSCPNEKEIEKSDSNNSFIKKLLQ